jgi:hypothetical protein
MIIETICEKGVVRLPSGLQYRRDAFKVTVEVPDQELVLSQSRSAPLAMTAAPIAQGDIRNRIDAILGPYKDQLQMSETSSVSDYKDMWHRHLDEKYLDRR